MFGLNMNVYNPNNSSNKSGEEESVRYVAPVERAARQIRLRQREAMLNKKLEDTVGTICGEEHQLEAEFERLEISEIERSSNPMEDRYETIVKNFSTSIPD